MTTDPAALLRHVLAELTVIGRDARTMHETAVSLGACPDLARAICARVTALLSPIATMLEQAAPVGPDLIDHEPGCEWAARQCVACTGTGWCVGCGGDGTNGEP